MTEPTAFEEEPDSLDKLELIDVLARDFLARLRNGERRTVDEYAQRHPELSDDIQKMFPLIASIEKVKIDRQESVDSSATLAGIF